ncbi:hypothetical protein GG344DRAFT_70876 [Lentinula edodes]|nr:hypothetical protein GG344DRAFT_70876 [Lentinula edodes]
MDEIGNEIMNVVGMDISNNSGNLLGGAFHNFQVMLDPPTRSQEQQATPGEGTIAPRLLDVRVDDTPHEIASMYSTATGVKHEYNMNFNENQPFVIPSYPGYMGPGDEHGPQDHDVGNAERVMAALQRRFSRVQTTGWNYFTTNSGQLWIRWSIDIEVHKQQNLAAEVEGMGDLVGKMYEKHIGLILSLREAARPGGMFQERTEIGRGRVEKEFDEAALEYMIHRASAGSVIGDRPHPTETRRGDLFATALARHFRGVRTMSWNFFTDCTDSRYDGGAEEDGGLSGGVVEPARFRYGYIH